MSSIHKSDALECFIASIPVACLVPAFTNIYRGCNALAEINNIANKQATTILIENSSEPQINSQNDKTRERKAKWTIIKGTCELFALPGLIFYAIIACCFQDQWVENDNRGRLSAPIQSPNIIQETPEIIQETPETIQETPEISQKTPEIIQETPEIVELLISTTETEEPIKIENFCDAHLVIRKEMENLKLDKDVAAQLDTFFIKLSTPSEELSDRLQLEYAQVNDSLIKIAQGFINAEQIISPTHKIQALNNMAIASKECVPRWMEETGRIAHNLHKPQDAQERLTQTIAQFQTELLYHEMYQVKSYAHANDINVFRVLISDVLLGVNLEIASLDTWAKSNHKDYGGRRGCLELFFNTYTKDNLLTHMRAEINNDELGSSGWRLDLLSLLQEQEDISLLIAKNTKNYLSDFALELLLEEELDIIESANSLKAGSQYTRSKINAPV